jgi:Skp family chaperone for outer membrane proteins
MMMKQKVLGALLAAVVAAGSVASAFADTIGYVDMDKIQDGYERAQAIIADIKVREAELRKMQADFVKQLEESRKANPKNPVSNDQLQKDLEGKLNAKLNEYRDWATARQKEIGDAIDNAIRDVKNARKIDVVLAKQVVLEGGSDLTNDVLGRLNSAPARPAAAPATKPAGK